MKVLSTSPSTLRLKSANVQNKKNVTNSVIQNNAILNNSLSEIMGRSQVAFTGSEVNRTNSFEYKNTYRFNQASEQIKYDKKTGDFLYTTYSSDGVLKKKIEVRPTLMDEIVTEFEPEETIVTHRKHDGYEIHKTDLRNRTTFVEHGDNFGKRVQTIYDYDIQRSIKREFFEENNASVVIMDLETGERIFEGPKAEETIVEEIPNGSRKITRNIITGDVYRVKEYKGKNVVSDFEYSRNTNKLIREFKYDPFKGYGSEKLYGEDGVLETLIKYSKRDKTIKSYDKIGNLTEYTYYEINRGNVTRKVEFSLKAKGAYKTETIYDDRNNFRKSFFEENDDNRCLSTQVFQDGELVYENFYKENGTIDYVREYGENGYYRDDYETADGNVYARVYSKNGEAYKIEKFRLGTDILIKRMEVLNDEGVFEEVIFDSEGKYPKERWVKDDNDAPILQEFFFEKCSRVECERIYNKDKSYTEKVYDIFGNLISSKKYNADGSLKLNSFDINFDEKHSQSLKDLMLKISNATASGDLKQITKEEWEILVKYLELNSIDELLKMDKATYRKLAKKFHPDANTDKAVNDISSELNFSIINALWARAQSFHSNK